MADKAIEDEVKQLRADFAALRGDVSELVRVLGDEGLRKADSAKESVAEELRARRDALRRQLNDTRMRGRETLEDLGDLTHEHPLSSLALAFSMGFLISKLLELGGRH